MRATIKDVAKHAGVSIAAVSYVIHNKKELRPTVRQRVIDAMAQLHYRPNVNAQSLKTNRTNKVGVIVPDIANPFFSNIVKKIDEILQKKKFQLVLCNSNYQIEREIAICSSFIQSGGVDTLILIAPRMTDKSLYEQSRDYPFFVVDRPETIKTKNIVFVYSDNYLGSSLVAENFFNHGYKSFACITGLESVPNANTRLEGFLDKLVDLGFDSNKVIIERGEFTFEDGFKCMQNILRRIEHVKKLGVFVCSDISAWGAMEAVKEMGLTIGENIGINGYDNIFMSQFFNPALTTVKTPSDEMGEEVANMVLDYVTKQKKITNCHSRILSASLVERNSV